MAAQPSHRKIYIIGGIAAAIMFTFCFAMVPVYNVLCKKIGLNTSVQNGELTTRAVATADKPDLSREIKVEFVTMNHMGMPWDFSATTKTIIVHPGQNYTVYFHAKNTMPHTMTVQAIPSMTPIAALDHFHKIECFCFRQQTLKGLASKEMPLIFNVDKDLPKETRVITLVYTLFDVTPSVKESRKASA